MLYFCVRILIEVVINLTTMMTRTGVVGRKLRACLRRCYHCRQSYFGRVIDSHDNWPPVSVISWVAYNAGGVGTSTCVSPGLLIWAILDDDGDEVVVGVLR